MSEVDNPVAEVENEKVGLMANAEVEVEEKVEADPEPMAHLDQPKGEEPAEKAERPEWLPEKFWKKEKIDNESLAKSYAELENKLRAGKHKAPQEYDLKSIVDAGVAADDPTVDVFKTWAKEHGISQDAFEELSTKYLEVNSGNLEDQVVDIERERQDLGKNANQIIEGNVRWGRSMVQKDLITEQEYSELEVLGQTANGQRLIQKMRAMMGERTLPTMSVDAGNQDRDLTESEARQMMADERYGVDAQYTRQVEKKFEKLYPGTHQGG